MANLRDLAQRIFNKTDLDERAVNFVRQAPQQAIHNANPFLGRALSQIPRVQTQVGRQLQQVNIPRLNNVPQSVPTPIGRVPQQVYKPLTNFVIGQNQNAVQSLGRSFERAGTGKFASKGNRIEDIGNALTFLPGASVGQRGAKVGIANLARQEGKFGTVLRTISPTLKGLDRETFHEITIVDQATGKAVKRLPFKSLNDARSAIERLTVKPGQIALPPREVIRQSDPILGLGMKDMSKGRIKGAEAGLYDTGKYLYHGTGKVNLESIAKEGLLPGLTSKKISLSKTEPYAKSFSEAGIGNEGKGVLLRVNQDLLKGKTFTTKSKVPSDQLNEVIARENIPPQALEIKVNGEWQPLSRVAQQPLSDAPAKLKIKGNVAAQIDKEINGGVSLKPAKPQLAQLKQSQNLQPTAPDLPPTTPPTGGNTSSLDNIIPQGQKQKGFLENIQTGKTSDELKTATGQLDQGYTPITNKESLAKAQETVTKTPNIAKEYVMSKEAPTAEKMATADLLIKKYEAENNIDEAIEVVNSMDRQLREAGQFVQAASIWNKLSPASLTRVAKKAYSSVGKELDTETEKIIYDKALGIQKITNPEERQREIFNLLNYVAEKLPPTKGEIFEAYRYQNMLSSPKTQLRNIYSNLLNTLVTRPINLGLEATYDIMKHPFNPMARDVALSDVPRYYKGVFTSVPNSIMAAKEAIKSGSSALKLDLGKGETTVDVLRKQNIPLKYSAVPRFMEGQDRFFSTLIASGEKSRWLRQGLDEAEANKRAIDLAQKYLYRNQLGKDAKDLPVFARALDSLGKFALEGRKLPIVGKPYSWFVPFVTTPINAAKVMVEHSPLGFVGGKYSSEQMAKATAGSIVMGVGGMLAMQDKTTWAAPTDKKQKELWYATGRKPYSIQIGDKWVPMWYFGPYALALGIPAALKHNYQDSKTAMSDGDLQKITKTVGELSKFVVNQTPLAGVGSFFQMLDGDADITAGNLAGFTIGQVIPAQGFIRWVNTIIDPTYRKARGFKETIMKDMPILSKQLEPYMLPNGEESKRLGINSFIPYDVGQVNNEYEPALQGRTAQLQTNAVKNKTIKEAKEQAGGQSTTIDNTIIANDGSTIDLTPPTTGQGIDAFTNQNWNYTKAREVWKAQTSGLIDDSTASQAYSKLGVDKEDVRYDYLAHHTNDIKTQYIVSKNLEHDELINRLITGRVESVTGSLFAANGVLDNLYEQGLISDAERKQLKAMKFDKEGNDLSKAKGGKKGKSLSIKAAPAPKGVKLAKSKTPKLMKLKARKKPILKNVVYTKPKKFKAKGFRNSLTSSSKVLYS